MPLSGSFKPSVMTLDEGDLRLNDIVMGAYVVGSGAPPRSNPGACHEHDIVIEETTGHDGSELP